jgi:hypothetical protein
VESAFVWQAGVRIAGTRIWCDALRANGVCFVSHALARLPGPARKGSPHARVVATERTALLAAALGQPLPDGALLAPFGRPFAVGRLRLELLPSGIAPGGAQLLVEMPTTDGVRRVLYAGGGVLPFGRPTVEPAQVRACDAIALDVRGAPVEAPPPRERSEAELLESVCEAIDAGEVPLVRATLAGAADCAALLGAASIPLKAHRRLCAFVRAHSVPPTHRQSFDRRGPRKGAPVKAFGRALQPGEALLWPADAPLPAVEPLRAIDAPDVRADLPSLVEHAAATGAREVWLLGGAPAGVDRLFHARKLTVRALAPPAQELLFRS